MACALWPLGGRLSTASLRYLRPPRWYRAPAGRKFLDSGFRGVRPGTVAGYGDYFVDLGRDLQNEIIARTEQKAF